jgi:hypothetical protein
MEQTKICLANVIRSRNVGRVLKSCLNARQSCAHQWIQDINIANAIRWCDLKLKRKEAPLMSEKAKSE